MLITCGVVAQLVEHLHGMQGVVGSSPISSTKFFNSVESGFSMAGVAQLVERWFVVPVVVGSNPVTRPMFSVAINL